jgi:hypothetical protein
MFERQCLGVENLLPLTPSGAGSVCSLPLVDLVKCKLTKVVPVPVDDEAVSPAYFLLRKSLRKL